MGHWKSLNKTVAGITASLPEPLIAVLSVLFQLVSLVLIPSFPVDKYVDQTHEKENDVQQVPLESHIFPTIRNHSIDNTNTANPQQCSTGLTTRLLPFKNKKGEIEWAFAEEDDIEGDALDIFKITDNKKDNFGVSMEDNLSKEDLSPTLSNSSNNDSIISAEKKHSVKEETPATLPPSPDSVHDKDGSGNITYHCSECDASFKIKGYLTRHMKKHAQKKAYHCPFHDVSIYIDEANVTHRCHPTGDFSRRDTYKTHLKSRHFVYPDGVRAKQRQLVAGQCSMCGEHFENSELWSEIHIEGAECKYLPAGFTGKSRIKRRIHKELRQANKDRASHNSTPISSAILSTPIASSAASLTPLTSGYTGSPTSSVASSQADAAHLRFRELPSGSPSYYPTHSESPLQNLFVASASIQQHEDTEEYDDEYCLDVDQMDVPRDWFIHGHQQQPQHV